MSFLFPRVSRPVLFGLGIGLTSSVLIHSPFRKQNLLYCDSVIGGSSPKDWSLNQYTQEARTPIVKKSGGLNPRAVRQISQGSIAGESYRFNWEG